MTDTDIHSCGYYCDRPACIKAQRNELRDKLFGEQWVKTYSGGKPNYTEPCERCGEVNPAEIHTCTPKQREMNKDEYIKFLESACRDIYEVWAGSEGIPMPETAPEGYLLFLVEQMRDIAKRALAQPEQEPVAWMEIEKYIDEDNLWDSRKILRDYDNGLGEPLYTTPPQRESVYCGCGDEIVAGDGARCGTCVAVKYKEKEWQGLTDDEIDDIWAEFNDGYSIIEETLWGYERAIEAKIREKNA